MDGELSRIYIVAGNKIAEILCKSLYDKEGVDVELEFKESIIKEVIEILNKEKGEFQKKVISLVFDELQQHAQSLFTVSTNSSDRSESFKHRVLQVCFTTNSSIIPYILNKAIQNNSGEYAPESVMTSMVGIIDETLKTTQVDAEDTPLEGGGGAAAKLGIPSREEIEKLEKDNEESRKEFLADSEKNDHLPSPEEAAIKLMEMLEGQQKTLIDAITKAPTFKEKIQESILTAFKNFFNKNQEEFYNDVLRGINNDSNNLLNNKIMKLHILYIILKDGSNPNSDYHFGYNVFKEALAKFITQNPTKEDITEDKYKEFCKILNELLITKIASVNKSAVLEIADSFGGGSSRKGKKQKGRKTKTKTKTRKRQKKTKKRRKY
jgi:hypothetical protein